MNVAEKGGYKAANTVHKIAVTGLIGFCLYSSYSLVSGYRQYFIMRKDPKYGAAIKARHDAVRQIIESKSEGEAKAE